MSNYQAKQKITTFPYNGRTYPARSIVRIYSPDDPERKGAYADLVYEYTYTGTYYSFKNEYNKSICFKEAQLRERHAEVVGVKELTPAEKEAMSAYVDKLLKKRTFKEEIQQDNLFMGWTWYISLMLLFSIFQDRIGLWILTTVVFLMWKSNK